MVVEKVEEEEESHTMPVIDTVSVQPRRRERYIAYFRGRRACYRREFCIGNQSEHLKGTRISFCAASAGLQRTEAGLVHAWHWSEEKKI